MFRRAVLRLALVLILSPFAATACLSPTLPLPPPEPADTIRPSAEDPGRWVVAGNCTVGALVTLFNERSRTGVLVEDTDRDGRYFTEIEAELCDKILIWQEVVTEDDGEAQSASRPFLIEERTPAGVVDDACP